MYKSAADVPQEYHYATTKDCVIIEKFIARKIKEHFPSPILLESMQEVLIRSGRECFTGYNAQIWYMITNYFKEKGLVDIYILNKDKYVLIDAQLILPLHNLFGAYDFSLRSEIHSFYKKYAKKFIDNWEIEALNSMVKKSAFDDLYHLSEQIGIECVNIAEEDLMEMLNQPFVKNIKGTFDLEKDTVEFSVIPHAGTYTAKTYIQKEEYKLGFYQATSKSAKVQNAKVSVILENVIGKKHGYRVPVISGYTHEFYITDYLKMGKIDA